MKPVFAGIGFLAWLASCGAEEAGGPDIPGFSADCSECHVLPDRPRAATAQAPGDYLRDVGQGLVREDAVFPTVEVHLVLKWPSRGVHDQRARQDCSGCHPMRETDGIGHGTRTYPDPEAAFRGGVDCATNCHGWLASDLAPGVLLAAADTAHTRLWRTGVRPEMASAFRFGGFNAGCGGCHNAAFEDHGAVVGCLDCHAFAGVGSALHGTHLAAAGTCDVCHTPESGPTPASRAACYGCHRSGHDPRTGW